MYPMQSLAVIAPVIFIILMIAFPVIGVFSGWKRALYWGGGNLATYIIGLIIWLLAGKAIGGAIAPALQNAISALKNADLTNIAQSIIAPVFFLIMMFIGNIILIINYYTWFKKVVIKKQTDKATNNAPTMKYKIINGAIGGVALPALLLPTTFAFTQLLFYTTTSKATREQNTLSKNLYDGLDKVNEVFNWFSYYKSTAKDFDALFAGLSLNETKVQIILPNGEEFQGSLTDAISETFTEGFQQIYNTASAADQPEDVVTEIKKLGESWNSLVDQAEDIMAPLFASENATQLVKDMFGLSGDPQKVDKETFDKIFTEGFDDVMNAFAEDGYTIKTLTVSEDGMDNIKGVIAQYYQPQTEGEHALTTEEIAKLDERMGQLVQLLFEVK